MKSYYNEFSKFPAEWIRNLIVAGIVPGGCVDERSISDVQADDLAGFRQFHAFCGVGGWPIALQEAGWPESEPVFTGSAPCQPFSSAGKQKGIADDRHLWPEFLRLIAACRPPHIFGEQVSGRKVTGKLFPQRAWKRLEPEARRAAEEEDREAWFRHVQTDLERIGYVVGHCVFPACSVGAPHARQRLYWYARLLDDTEGERREVCDTSNEREAHAQIDTSSDSSDSTVDRRGSGAQYVGDDRRTYGKRGKEAERSAIEEEIERRKNTMDAEPYGVPEQLADTTGDGQYKREYAKNMVREAEEKQEHEPVKHANGPPDCCTDVRPGPTNGHWGAADWIFCRDNKWRPIKSRSSPLSYGLPGRTSKMRTWIRLMGFSPKVAEEIFRMSKEIIQEARSSRNGQLAGYGNAIVIPQAVEFIRACMEELGY